MEQDLIAGKEVSIMKKRVEKAHLLHMPYAKADLFIDVKTRKIIDFGLLTKRAHDAKVAKKIFK